MAIRLETEVHHVAINGNGRGGQVLLKRLIRGRKPVGAAVERVTAGVVDLGPGVEQKDDFLRPGEVHTHAPAVSGVRMR
jgi:hypothetical protein